MVFRPMELLNRAGSCLVALVGGMPLPPGNARGTGLLQVRRRLPTRCKCFIVAGKTLRLPF